MLSKFKELLQSRFLLIVLYFFACGVGVSQILDNDSHNGKLTWESFTKSKGAIGVVSVKGVISSAAAEKINKQLDFYEQRPDIKAVILKINSPGGTVGGSQEVYERVMKLRKNGKKVTVSVGDVAASGGYYIAAGADKIFANPGSLTGSIGVIMQAGNVQELFKKVGVRMEVVKSSVYKDIASPYREMSAQERELIQGIITETYDQFVGAIAAGRAMPKEKVLALADGRIFTGSQAKKEGLIDELGSFDFTVEQTAKLAGIEGKPRLIEENDSFEKFMSYFGAESSNKMVDKVLSIYGVQLAYLWEGY